MNWKREAEDKLRNYAAKKNSLDRSEAELQRLEDEFSQVRSVMSDNTPVQGGGNLREDCLLDNIVLRGELRKAQDSTRRWLRLVDSALEELSSEELLILNRFYIYRAKGHVERLQAELNVEKSQVYNLKNAALRHFTLALYGVTEI